MRRDRLAVVATGAVMLCCFLALEVFVLLIRDIIKLREIEARSVGAHSQFDGQPRVALLFLTRGPMPFEPVWRRFLQAPPGAGAGSPKHGSWLGLFAVYMHPHPNFTFPPESLFYGREVPDRVAVEWGQHSVMEAERRLVAAAVHDPRNARFILLSETCVPLYPAPAAYLQLMGEVRSRINACAVEGSSEDAERRMEHRWQQAMLGANITREQWRKSSQWFSLTRRHAAECWVDQSEARTRFCVSDEHYVPTLLAHLGLEGECFCDGIITHTHWDGNYFHPKTYAAADAEPKTLTQLRGGDACDGAALVAAGAAAAERLAAGAAAAAPSRGAQLPPSCPLFARKMDGAADKEWLRLLAPVLEG